MEQLHSYHSPNCTAFRQAVRVFIKCRREAYLTKEEIVFLVELTLPCQKCYDKVADKLSPAGRLYALIYDEESVQITEHTRVIDMFGGIDNGRRD